MPKPKIGEIYFLLDPVLETFEEGCRRGERPASEPLLLQVEPEFRPLLRQHLEAIAREYEIQEARTTPGRPNSQEANEQPVANDVDTVAGGQIHPSGKELSPGSRLGTFEVVEEIGRGGMGVVYRACDLSLARHVALKVLSPHWTDEATLQARFEIEARATARLDHEGIVKIHDFGRENGRSFLVMQLIDGRPLSDLITRSNVAEETSSKSAAPPSGVDERTVARWGEQIARALAYAHDHGVIHRDIKPGNILLDKNDATWVTDFGLAQIGESDLTRTGDLLGTVRYMSPERLDGDNRAQGDIFALGLTLYELALGHTAHAASTQGELVRQILSAPPPLLTSRKPEFPRDLALIIAKALEPSPDDRYESGHRLADDLDAFLQGRPISIVPRTALAELRRWARLHRQSAVLLGLLLFVLVGTLGASLVVSSKLRNQRNDLVASEQRERNLKEIAEEVHRETLAQLYRSRMGEASSLYTDPIGIQGLRALTQEWTASRDRRAHRGWEWSLFDRESHQEARAITAHRHGLPSGCAWSPDGRFVATCANQAIVWDPKTWQRIAEFDIDRALRIAWKPDGSVLALGGQRGVHLIDVATWKVIETLDFPSIVGLAWHPTDEIIAIRRRKRDKLMIVNSKSKRILAALADGVGEGASFGFSSDGQRLAYQAGRGDLVIVNTRDWSETTRRGRGPHDTGFCTISPDGARLIRATGTGLGIEVADAITGSPLRAVGDFEAVVLEAAWFSDNRRIALISSDTSIRIIDTETGEVERMLRGHSDRVAGLALSPDETRLVSLSWDQTIRTWNLERRPTWLRLQSSGLSTAPRSHSLSWHPTEHRLIASWRNGQDEWDLRDHPPVKRPSAKGSLGLWSPSGDRILSIVQSNDATRAVVTDARTGEELHATPYAPMRGAQGRTWATWEPDGKRIHLNDMCAHHIWTLGDSSPPSVLRSFQEESAGAARHPRGGRFARGQYGTIVIIDEESGEELYRHKYPERSRRMTRVVWTPDGQSLLVSYGDGTNELIDPVSGRILGQLRGHNARVMDAQWSPDGQRLATASKDGTVRIWTPGTFEANAVFRLSFRVASVAWSHDSRLLAALTCRGEIIVWDAGKKTP